MNPIIEVKNLKYKYPHTDKLVLDDISFTIEKGEFIGIVGANGACILSWVPMEPVKAH